MNFGRIYLALCVALAGCVAGVDSPDDGAKAFWETDCATAFFSSSYDEAGCVTYSTEHLKGSWTADQEVAVKFHSAVRAAADPAQVPTEAIASNCELWVGRSKMFYRTVRKAREALGIALRCNEGIRLNLAGDLERVEVSGVSVHRGTLQTPAGQYQAELVHVGGDQRLKLSLTFESGSDDITDDVARSLVNTATITLRQRFALDEESCKTSVRAEVDAAAEQGLPESEAAPFRSLVVTQCEANRYKDAWESIVHLLGHRE